MEDFDKKTAAHKPVNLAERFADSKNFKDLFAKGMHLVEESAAYLDGPGREAARGLDRSTSVAYGMESMRLTTRLMQLASWLLLQRAANEGEMSREQILEEKEKVKLENLSANDLGEYRQDAFKNLPEEFGMMVQRSLLLQNQIILLDRELYAKAEAKILTNPVNEQIDLLSTAFDAKKAG